MITLWTAFFLKKCFLSSDRYGQGGDSSYIWVGISICINLVFLRLVNTFFSVGDVQISCLQMSCFPSTFLLNYHDVKNDKFLVGLKIKRLTSFESS